MEIERKFLVEPSKVPGSLANPTYIRQGYLPTSDGFSVRVRLTGPHKDIIMGSELTVKKGLTERSRYEYTFPMNIDEARELYAMCSDKLEKIRYHIVLGKHIWDLDVFQVLHQGLVLAEIELKSEDEEFERPLWLGTEVTGQLPYLNQNLAKLRFGEKQHD